MSAIESKEAWESYREHELAVLTPLLTELGFSLDEAQVHTGGERYLMSGRKLVLTGRRTFDNLRVVIKVSADAAGVQEIERERTSREVLRTLNFASRAFFMPHEILYLRQGAYTILVTEYIAQDRTFLSHELDEQFFLALRAFEAQEGVHATTYAHTNTIQNVFGMVTAQNYLDSFAEFRAKSLMAAGGNETLATSFNTAWSFLTAHKTTIERYCGFLTHHDFVPHNLRVAGREVYLLDQTSIYFGNKYESWARFLNYMLQYNPPLEQALAAYVLQNQGPDAYLSLRLMRVYKIGFLLKFYAEALAKTSGDLHTMTRIRLDFWSDAMVAMAKDEPIAPERVIEFVKQQEMLRSAEERKRQEEILGREKVLPE